MRPAGSRWRRESTPLLLFSALLAAAWLTSPAEGSLPRTGFQDANPAALAGAGAVDSGRFLTAGLETPFSLITVEELEKALACNPAPEAGGLNLVEGSLLEPPELTSRACEASFSLYLEPVDFGLNPQRGPPLEIPDLHQGWFVADPKTRIGGFGLELEDLTRGECSLSLGLRRGYEVEGWGLAEEERPDPWGLQEWTDGSSALKPPVTEPAELPPPRLSGPRGIVPPSAAAAGAGTATVSSVWVAPVAVFGAALYGHFWAQKELAEAEAYLAEANAVAAEANLRRRRELRASLLPTPLVGDSPYRGQFSGLSSGDPRYHLLVNLHNVWVSNDSPWKLGSGPRGLKIEDFLEKNGVLKGRLPPGFEAIDFFDRQEGVATSVKSIDISTHYQRKNPRRLYSKIKEFVDILAAYPGGELSGETVLESEIKKRQLYLAIPGNPTPEQRTAIERAAAYARSEKHVEVQVFTVE